MKYFVEMPLTFLVKKKKKKNIVAFDQFAINVKINNKNF